MVRCSSSLSIPTLAGLAALLVCGQAHAADPRASARPITSAELAAKLLREAQVQLAVAAVPPDGMPPPGVARGPLLFEIQNGEGGDGALRDAPALQPDGWSPPSLAAESAGMLLTRGPVPSAASALEAQRIAAEMEQLLSAP